MYIIEIKFYETIFTLSRVLYSDVAFLFYVI